MQRKLEQVLGRGPAPAVWPDRFPGAYLGWGKRGPIFTGPEHHALVIGPPRSGKTSSVILPALATWPGPAVATSTKPDLLAASSRRRHQLGDVWVWDPTGRLPLPDGARALQWTPLLGCAEWDTAIERGWALTGAARPNPSPDSVFWVERAATLLACLLHAAAVHAKPLSTVTGWLARRDVFGPLEALGTAAGTGPAVDLLGGISAADPRGTSGVYATADSALAAYRSPATLEAADHPNFDPAAFVAGADTVYLVAPAATQARHAPVVCALLDQLRHHVALRASTWPPLLWALDEAANIAPLPGLPGVLADGGSQGLLVLTCLQDLSQARHRWGRQADGFLTLHPTTLLLPGVADPATLKAVTTLAGQVDRPHGSVSRTGLRATTTDTTRRVPLLPEDVIAHGWPGFALRLVGARPDWLQLTPAHATPWIRQLLTGGGR